MADRRVEGIVKAMDSIAKINQENYKLKRLMLLNDQKTQQNFITDLQKMKAEQELKNANAPFELEQERLKKSIPSANEERLAEGQRQRDVRYDVDTMYKRGGTIDEDRVEAINKDLNMDITPELEAGRGEVSVGPDGRKKWRVLSDSEWNAKVSQGKFTEAEIKNLDDLQEEHRRWADIKGELDNLGLNENTIGDIQFENVMSPMGPLSLPARFNLIGQYAQDPKYTGVKRKIEQAFQSYRKRITGAQASYAELNFLRQIIPALKDNPRVFFSTLNDMLGDTENAFNSKLDLYERFGRDTSKLKDVLQTRKTSSGSKPSSTRVKVKGPNGKTGTIPADQLERAISLGYERY